MDSARDHAHKVSQYFTPSFTDSTPKFKILVLKPFPRNDHKMIPCSVPLRDKHSSLMCADQIISSHMSTPWDETTVAPRTLDWSSSFLLTDPKNAADDLHTKPNFTINLLSPPITKSKPRKPSRACQLQVKLLKAIKTFTKREISRC